MLWTGDGEFYRAAAQLGQGTAHLVGRGDSGKPVIYLQFAGRSEHWGETAAMVLQY